jgi:LCP family protein required for cell wall assembly
MERIQRGLEEFLQQEMAEEVQSEKKIDIISTNRNSSSKPTRIIREDFDEDWDSRENRKKSGKAVKSDNQSGTSRNRENPSKRNPSGENSSRRNQNREQQGRDNQIRNNRIAEDKSKGKKKKRKKKFRLKRFLFKALLIVALLAVGWYFMVGLIYSKMTYHEIESLTSSPMKEDGVVNILLIGNDSRENGEDGRSDAMILLSISSRTKKIYMTSLLRDMYVDIPGHDGNRLNAAYSFGGAELLMETVEKNLGITVNRYVLVNFEAFANLVDAVGGVDLELSSAEIEWVNAYLNEYNLLTGKEFGTDYMDTSVEGLVHLNGPQALAYSRNRYIGTDFGRTERQRKVLTEVFHSLPKAVLLHPGKLVNGLMPNLTTNLTQWECYRLSLMAPAILTYDIEQQSIPLEGTYQDATVRGMAVLEVDFDTNKEYLQEILYEK